MKDYKDMNVFEVAGFFHDVIVDDLDIGIEINGQFYDIKNISCNMEGIVLHADKSERK